MSRRSEVMREHRLASREERPLLVQRTSNGGHLLWDGRVGICASEHHAEPPFNRTDTGSRSLERRIVATLGIQLQSGFAKEYLN
jgi:hypothetical protein